MATQLVRSPLTGDMVNVLTWPNPAQAPADKITFGAVHLDVTDLNRSTAFWRDVVGLVERSSGGDHVELGTAEETLISLYGGAKAGFQNGFSGIYHPAIHAPTEADFARIVLRLLQAGWHISPTDHVFSKAIYLLDPDGITVEITLETPERMESVQYGGRTMLVIDKDGVPRSGRDRLDLDAVLQSLPGNDSAPVVNGTRVGHVHLYGADVNASHAFYKGLGFSDGIYAPSLGAVDFGAGGAFNHRIGVNTWQGAGAPPAPEGTARMRHFTMRFDTPPTSTRRWAPPATPSKPTADTSSRTPPATRSCSPPATPDAAHPTSPPQTSPGAPHDRHHHLHPRHSGA
ncbi:VOC family protein [Microbacterium sp. NPDC006705]|uniref:VOC family protein n=1 Tax=Microbacterium sp. NPDC006705 TaxID=3364181 RepID=UPI00384A542B